jgi:hypothetical protein
MIRNGILALVGLMFMAATCEKPVDINIAEPNPKLVLICNFTDDDLFKVAVSKSQGALSSNIVTEYIGDANVEVWEGEQLLTTLFLVEGPNGDPPYFTNDKVKPKVGVEYTIKARAEGFISIQAKNKIPQSIALEEVSIKDLQVFSTTKPGEKQYNYNISLRFIDPIDTDNYYHVNLYQKTNLYRVSLGDTIITSTQSTTTDIIPVSNSYFEVSSPTGGLLLDDSPFNGQEKSLVFPMSVIIDTKQAILGNIDVELRSVSKEYYLYLSSIKRQKTNPSVPYAEPVILFNNIINGQGIFAGYSKSRSSRFIGR